MQILEESGEGDVGDAAWKHDEMKVDVHVDSDWGKGPERRSMSGGMTSDTVVKHWSITQARALSTAKADYQAVATKAAEVLGKQSVTDLGLFAQVRLWTDSNAAKAIASR